VITSPVRLLPDELTFFMPHIEFVSDVVPEFQALAENSALARIDGTSVVPYITVVADVVNHTDMLSGNETIDGGEGDDLIFGDNANFYAPLYTGLKRIDDALEDVSDQLVDTLHHLRHVASDYDIFEHTVLGVVDQPQLIQVGNDTLNGGGGNDTIVGDNGTLIAPATVRQGLGLEGDLKASALELFNFVRDVEWIATDFNFVATEAHAQVLDALIDDAIADTPTKKKPKKHELIDLDLRDLVLQTDKIDAGTGDDFIIGDNVLIVTPVAASETFKKAAGKPLDLDKQALKDIKKALDHEDRHRDRLLKDHIRYDHDDFHKHFPKHRDQHLIRYRSGYDYAVGNDTLYGGAGNDLIIGDMGLIVQPVLLEGPITSHDARDLNHRIDHLLKDADDLMRNPFSERCHRHHHHSYRHGGWEWWHSKHDFDHDILSGSDIIDAGSGNDVVFGDSAVVTPVFAAGDSTGDVRYEARLDKGWGGNDGYWRGGDDLILGGEGDDILFGQQGEDTLDGGDGNDILYGGSGRDTLFGGAGEDKLFGGSGHDHLDGGPGKDKIKHGGSDWCGGGIDVTAAIQNPWLQQFLLDIEDAADTIDKNSSDWLTFKKKGHCHHGRSHR